MDQSPKKKTKGKGVRFNQNSGVLKLVGGGIDEVM